MANFKVWAENSDNLADITTQESEQTDGVLRVEEGLIQGDSVKSDEINSILRQNSLMTTALAEAFLSDQPEIDYQFNDINKISKIIKERTGFNIVKGNVSVTDFIFTNPPFENQIYIQQSFNIKEQPSIQNGWIYKNGIWQLFISTELKTIIVCDEAKEIEVYDIIPETSLWLQVFGAGGPGGDGLASRSGGYGGYYTSKHIYIPTETLKMQCKLTTGSNKATSSAQINFFNLQNTLIANETLTAKGGSVGGETHLPGGGSGGGGGGDWNEQNGGAGSIFGGGGGGGGGRTSGSDVNTEPGKGGNGGILGGGGGAGGSGGTHQYSYEGGIANYDTTIDYLFEASFLGDQFKDTTKRKGGTETQNGAEGIKSPDSLTKCLKLLNIPLNFTNDIVSGGTSSSITGTYKKKGWTYTTYAGGGGGGGINGIGGNGGLAWTDIQHNGQAGGGGGGGGGGFYANGGNGDSHPQGGGGGGGGGYGGNGGDGYGTIGGGGGGYGPAGKGGSFATNNPNGGIAAGGAGESGDVVGTGGPGIILLHYYKFNFKIEALLL